MIPNPNCPDCCGSGHITLLTSRKPCGCTAQFSGWLDVRRPVRTVTRYPDGSVTTDESAAAHREYVVADFANVLARL